LKAKLRTRAAQPSDVDRVTVRLEGHGYLDDRRFAESYAAARVENDGFGRIRVLQDLRIHRVSGPTADQAVERALGNKSEAELIDTFIERRMASAFAAGPIADDRKLAAAYRKLRRAGFSSGAILSALKGRAVHPELIDDPAAGEDEEPG
jgi:regulatory protein